MRGSATLRTSAKRRCDPSHAGRSRIQRLKNRGLNHVQQHERTTSDTVENKGSHMERIGRAVPDTCPLISRPARPLTGTPVERRAGRNRAGGAESSCRCVTRSNDVSPGTVTTEIRCRGARGNTEPGTVSSPLHATTHSRPPRYEVNVQRRATQRRKNGARHLLPLVVRAPHRIGPLRPLACVAVIPLARVAQIPLRTRRKDAPQRLSNASMKRQILRRIPTGHTAPL